MHLKNLIAILNDHLCHVTKLINHQAHFNERVREKFVFMHLVNVLDNF